MPGLLLEKVDSTLDVPTDCILRLPDEILQYILTIDHRDWITWCPYLTEDDWTKQRLQYNPDPW